MIRFVTILACLVICRNDGVATVVSVDIGGTVKLNCSACNSTAVRWQRHSVANSDRIPEFASRFNVTFLLEGFSQLVISNVKPSDDGRYYCIKSESAEKMMNIRLRVIGYRIPPRAVFIGTTATFSCDSFSGSDIQWDFRSTSPQSSPVTVYNGQQVATRFQSRFDVTVGADSISYLSIVDVQLSDAGVYECVNKATGKQSSRGSLTVLGEEPRCAINSQNELNCRVCYAGETEPNITCHGDIEENINASSVRELNKTCRLYTKSLAYDGNITGSDSSCSVIFATQHGVDYNYTWKASQSTTDLDEPGLSGSLSIYPLNRVYFQHGDKLKCVAGSTNPEIPYQWVVKDKVKSGSVYDIDVCDFISESSMNSSESLQNVSVSVLCIARHGVDASTSKTVNINIVYSKEEAKNCGSGISGIVAVSAISVAVVSALTACMTLAFVCLRRPAGYICKKCGEPDVLPAEVAVIGDNAAVVVPLLSEAAASCETNNVERPQRFDANRCRSTPSLRSCATSISNEVNCTDDDNAGDPEDSPVPPPVPPHLFNGPLPPRVDDVRVCLENIELNDLHCATSMKADVKRKETTIVHSPPQAPPLPPDLIQTCGSVRSATQKPTSDGTDLKAANSMEQSQNIQSSRPTSDGEPSPPPVPPKITDLLLPNQQKMDANEDSSDFANLDEAESVEQQPNVAPGQDDVIQYAEIMVMKSMCAGSLPRLNSKSPAAVYASIDHTIVFQLNQYRPSRPPGGRSHSHHSTSPRHHKTDA